MVPFLSGPVSSLFLLSCLSSRRTFHRLCTCWEGEKSQGIPAILETLCLAVMLCLNFDYSARRDRNAILRGGKRVNVTHTYIETLLGIRQEGTMENLFDEMRGRKSVVANAANLDTSQ